MINRIKFILFILFVLIFSSNCVEHKIGITVEPGGSFIYSHFIEGDKNDILDLDYPIPTSSEWNIKNNITDESDIYFYSFEKDFNQNQSLPFTFYNDDSLDRDILLNHKMILDYKNRIINEYYNFNFIFEGRKAEEKYPTLYSFLQNQENPPEGWVYNGLSYIFKQAILETGFGFNIENILTLAIEDWLENIKQNYNDDSLQENFENIKNEGIQIVKNQLIDDSLDKFISQLTKFEKEARITIDLTDDVFEFFIVLPGFLQETNADSIFNDTLLWRFSGLDFANNDYQLIAKSSIYHKSRFHWTLVIIMLVVSFAILYWISSKVPDPMKSSK